MKKPTPWKELSLKDKQKRGLAVGIIALLLVAVIITTICLVVLINPNKDNAVYYERQVELSEMKALLDEKDANMLFPKEDAGVGGTLKYFVGSKKGWLASDVLDDKNIDVHYYRVQNVITNQSLTNNNLFTLSLFGYTEIGAEYAEADGQITLVPSDGIYEILESVNGAQQLRLTYILEGKRYEAVGKSMGGKTLDENSVTFLRSKLLTVLNGLE